TTSAPQPPSQTTSPTTMRSTIDLPVPTHSQETHKGEYPKFDGGGEAWCSPTSTEMVVEYWGRGPSATDLRSLPADPVLEQHHHQDASVDWAALHTYDQDYQGTGNWPFNTAYAAYYGLDSSVRQFDSLQAIEGWIKQGIPVVVSINWDNTSTDTSKHLDGVGVPKSAGHLMVVRGFTKDGAVITNDPAFANNQQVRHVYRRDQFEFRWQAGSAGAVYLIKAI
ncbi:MAG: peptidase C39 family protein, partial [Candidatus Dormibacteraceae bacterium]